MGAVGLEVADDVVARHPLPVAAGDPEARQVGQPAHRMQVQPLVVTTPGGADRVRAVHDNGLDAATLQHGGDGQARRPGPDDNSLGHAERLLGWSATDRSPFSLPHSCPAGHARPLS